MPRKKNVMICYITLVFMFWSSILFNNPMRELSFTGDDNSPVERLIIDLNRASEAELCIIDGIGYATAKAIVTYRESSGGFTSTEQIMDVYGIGEKKFSAWREFICIS